MKYKDGLRTIREMNVAGGPGGMFGYAGGGAGIGQQGGNVGNVDFYAPGDARIPSILGMGKQKGKKGKKNKNKIPIYRRTFAEALATESLETPYTLNCVLYTESVDYQKLMADLLERLQIPFETEDKMIMLEGNDEWIQSILNKIQGVTTAEPFENGDIMALIGEMDVTFTKPEKKREEYDQEQLKAGIAVEHEHTEDENVAAIIAMNHLDEFPNYYVELAKMEAKLKKQ